MDQTLAIDVINLHKHYGSFHAVNGINFQVRGGEIYSLLGPNGAGKSTTISILSGLLTPTQGDAHILGHSVTRDSRAARQLLGVVPQDIALYPDLSARENLMFWGRMYGMKGNPLTQKVNQALEMIGLSQRQNGKISTFSGGMKRRVNIAAALLHNPRVVIMDEPTVGIDPQSRRHILDSVKELNRQGVTVLYTTHYMEEAEELSEHIAIMDKGEIIALGTHAELIRLVGEQARVTLTVSGGEDAVMDDWKSLPGVSQATRTDGTILAVVKNSNLAVPHLFTKANQQGIRINAVEIQEPNLETVFLHLTGKALRD